MAVLRESSVCFPRHRKQAEMPLCGSTGSTGKEHLNFLTTESVPMKRSRAMRCGVPFTLQINKLSLRSPKRLADILIWCVRTCEVARLLTRCRSRTTRSIDMKLLESMDEWRVGMLTNSTRHPYRAKVVWMMCKSGGKNDEPASQLARSFVSPKTITTIKTITFRGGSP